MRDGGLRSKLGLAVNGRSTSTVRETSQILWAGNRNAKLLLIRGVENSSCAMPLSWNEIRHNAIKFSNDWAGVGNERAEAKTFWDDFFRVFGMRRRHIATFEERVRGFKDQYGFIDLFWPGTLIVEHKSSGHSLSRASAQAFTYINMLIRSGRTDEVPRYVIVSDFARFAVHDLEPDQGGQASIEFSLKELHSNIHHFAFIPGYKQHRLSDEDPINLKAVELIADLHDRLENGGYTGHNLERFLVRLLFCLFAEDSGVFDRSLFQLYIENHTRPDGSDLGQHLAHLFEVLDTPHEQRQANLNDDLAAFPYVNGALFKERLKFADFDRGMRESLLKCARFDWSRISPAIFGSLFQSIMEPQERRQIGAHYTSERDILKVIRALFLDDLRAEFDSITKRRNAAELKRFHKRLSEMRFLDPACGCGNFLVVTYREIRKLEIEVIRSLQGSQRELETILSIVDVDAFYGIEINEWPARIAEVAMWLIDHQMNVRLSEVINQYFSRLPLAKSATIAHGNALAIPWNEVLPKEKCSFVIGNPPFVGKKEQTPEQRAEKERLFGRAPGAGVLDYVTCWYLLAAEYIQGTEARVGFVSTNSITQGQQIPVLWSQVFESRKVTIFAAHRTFAWQSEARGGAHVHVVIICFKAGKPPKKRMIFEYHGVGGEPHAHEVNNINGYLVDAPSVTIVSRRSPMSPVPAISYGSMMIDRERSAPEDSGLLVSPEGRDALLKETPALEPFILRALGGHEFLNNVLRYCLWLVNAPPELIRSSRLVMDRLENVKRFRTNSNRAQTRKLAATPFLFGEIRQPNSDYLLIPKVSSEARRYLPVGFLPPTVIATGSALTVPNASQYHFGILSSTMHNAWMRYVGGRTKSDYQYSAEIVYNNFPWPPCLGRSKIEAVSTAAASVLAARANYSNSSLADLYDPHSMPRELSTAHAILDAAVDKCYRSKKFSDERSRVEFLFREYETLMDGRQSS